MEISAIRYDTGEAVRLRLAEGRVAEVSQLPESGDLPWIAPGLVDLQVNGYLGQEFSSLDLTVEKVAAILRAHEQLGVTALCPTVTTNSPEAIRHALRTLAAAAETPDLSRQIAGIHLEGPYLSREDGPRGAHPTAYCKPPDWDEFQRFQEAAGGRIRLLTLSPEFDGSAAFIARATASGVVAALGHLSATGDQIRAAVDAGARLSTHLGNGAHRTLPRHPNYLWDQLAEDRLLASLIVDGHHLPPEVVQTFVRAKTPERCILVSDVSGMAGLPPGEYDTQLCRLEILPEGRIVIAGQRQLLAAASAPLPVGVWNVVQFAGVSLNEALAMATTRPAALVGHRPGGFAPGDPADFVLFRSRSSFAVEQTIRVGRVVQ
jgi:N-acetylglucosamine-6-phosphate deacetylase